MDILQICISFVVNYLRLFQEFVGLLQDVREFDVSPRNYVHWLHIVKQVNIILRAKILETPLSIYHVLVFLYTAKLSVIISVETPKLLKLADILLLELKLGAYWHILCVVIDDFGVRIHFLSLRFPVPSRQQRPILIRVDFDILLLPTFLPFIFKLVLYFKTNPSCKHL
jgi:hypothetical protein